MDMNLKNRFIESWKKYFPGAELPFTFFYTDENQEAELVRPPKAHQCMIGLLAKVRKGTDISFDSDSFGCGGGKRYLGYANEIMPGFEYFLSCGIEGEMEGERYKESPEIVKELMTDLPGFEAPGKYTVFKRWDMLKEDDFPEVVIFFASPDVLSGLFTLSGFDQVESESVISPFAAGCGSIVMYPLQEKKRENPRAVLGMFDVSVRPYIPKDMLSFAVPITKFEVMVNNMDESFLITGSWDKVKKRIKG